MKEKNNSKKTNKPVIKDAKSFEIHDVIPEV